MSALNLVDDFSFSKNNVISISDWDPFADDGLNDTFTHQITGTFTKHISHQAPVNNNLANELGSYPITGQIVGILRAAYGIVKAVASLFAAIFSEILFGDADGWDNEASDGLSHVGRGMAECLTPLTSNILMSYDETKARLARSDLS